MRAFFAILGRELRLRGAVLSLALLLGCVPVVLAFFESGVLGSASFAGMSMALLAGAILVGVTALFSGWSLIAPEQAAGRLSWVYSRPVSWSSIWGGKLTAAVALPVAAGALALLPTLAVDHTQWRGFWSTPKAGAQLLGAGIQVLFLVGIGNAASVAYRSRWMQRAMDLALLAGLLLVVLRPSRLLTIAAWSAGCASQVALPLAPIALAPMALALLFSSGGQAQGGTDPRRSHAFFSLTFWPIAFSIVAALAGVGHLMDTASPSHLRQVERAEGAPRGGWIFVSGPVRWGQYAAAYLYEPGSGRYVSLGSAGHVSRLSFSRDGKLAAIVQKDPLEPQFGWTRVVRLGAEVPVAETVFGDLAEDVAVSRDYLVALRRDQYADSRERSPNPAAGWGHTESYGLDVYRLPPDGRVTSIPSRGRVSENWDLSGLWQSPLVLLDDGRLRIGLREDAASWHPECSRSRLFVLNEDLTALLRDPPRSPTRRGSGPQFAELDAGPCSAVPLTLGEAVELRVNAPGDRLLLLRLQRHPDRGFPPGWRICLHQSGSADHLHTLAAGSGSVDADFLSEGLRAPSGDLARLAVVEVLDGRGSLRMLGADGREFTPNPWREDLGPALSVSVAGEPAPGYLLLGVRRSATDFGYTFVPGPAGSWRESGIFPVAPRAEAEDSHGAGRPTAGSLGSRLFISEDGTLVRYDPETRARTVLLGRAGG